ncbi:magnesium and cobalt transport protein CorA [Sphingosinicella sp. LHD-64]|uniref:magnesium and cobalt transport protein CorA n=1 Tax=Sphingosinicella sp. LHD-64 TaxID=3072139 RepID=UPI0028104023|nr:magnesium and cobalt transport protein CorA [Sphingosinicella sp. LHD-64]MDQ8757922.1 magnesium and cobalt transport protein CorA [Sphingosinicella sp. LHD-64]
MADDQSPSRPASLIAATVYHKGCRVADIGIDEGGGWAAREGHVVWIGLLEPSEAELRTVQRQFGLNELAIEDAGQAHQRPKLQRYGESLFVVARTAELIDGRIEFGETHLFVGCGYVVSIRHGPSASYKKVRAHCEASPALLVRGETYILHSILDFIVDNYQGVLESVHEEAEGIENDVLAERLSAVQVQRLYILRRDLLRLRAGVLPLVEVCRRLEHSDLFEMDAKMELLFRDVTDHVRSVQEEIDGLREMLAFAFEASLLTSQSQQTMISRRLAAWAAILAVPTAVAGIYGMNFENMPELRWANGYYFVLALVLATCFALYVNFRRRDWL